MGGKVGRWTREEHEAFLQGLRMYGREWKRVSQQVKTRSSAQIRSHAQKHFAKNGAVGEKKSGGGAACRSGPASRYPKLLQKKKQPQQQQYGPPLPQQPSQEYGSGRWVGASIDHLKERWDLLNISNERGNAAHHPPPPRLQQAYACASPPPNKSGNSLSLLWNASRAAGAMVDVSTAATAGDSGAASHTYVSDATGSCSESDSASTCSTRRLPHTASLSDLAESEIIALQALTGSSDRPTLKGYSPKAEAGGEGASEAATCGA